MSLHARRTLTLLCDAGCGVWLDTELEGGISARLEAGRKGWLFVEGVWFRHPDDRDKYGKAHDSKQTTRGIDVCPDCETPEEGSQLPKRTEVTR